MSVEQSPHSGRNGRSSNAENIAADLAIYSRKEVGELLNVSPQVVRNIEREHGIRGTYDASDKRNRVLFTLAQVDEMRAIVESRSSQREPGQFTGADAKAAFALLRAGKSPCDVVEALGMHPATVRAIVEARAELQLLGGGMCLERADVEALSELLGEPVGTAAELREAVCALREALGSPKGSA